MRSILAIGLLIACSAAAQPFTTRVQRAISSVPQARQAFWGIRVVDLASGATVYRKNDSQFFIPASNAKLFSTALALVRLGPDHRFHTTVTAPAKPDAAGRVSEIHLIGGGDPNLSAREVPYRRDETTDNPLAAIEDLADQIRKAGVRSVQGDIVGDDTAFLWEPYPEGWAADDPVWEYGAPVSALTLNDNSFTLTISPGIAQGAPARLALTPRVEYLIIHNRTETVLHGETKLRYERLPGSDELVVSGTVLAEAAPRSVILAVEDPAMFAASALRSALLKRGIQVSGGVSVRHRYTLEQPAENDAGFELGRHTSAPLVEILEIVNKVSQNLHAEIVLREVARVSRGVGSLKGGLQELEDFLTEIGIEEEQYAFRDASGLSRLTLVTPTTVSKLLTFMYRPKYRDAWLSTLPVGGEDGTLYGRFNGEPDAARIVAKTGSLSHISGLSGYALRPDGRAYAFSIFVNNYNVGQGVIRKIIDEVALALVRPGRATKTAPRRSTRR